MKYLITGSSGFWGSNMLDYILNIDNNSDITCIYYSNAKSLDGYKVTKIRCNLENTQDVNKLIDNYDCIIHLSSIVSHSLDNADKNIASNVNSTKNVLDLAVNINERYEKNCRIVIASTMGTVACFKDKNKYANETSEFSEISKSWPYYLSKMKIEDLVKTYTNLDTVIIRPPMILGPNDKKGRATKRVRKFLNSLLLLLFIDY